MKSIALILALLVLLPATSEAAFSRAGIKKPVRGRYQSVADQEADRRNAVRRKDPVISMVSYTNRGLRIALQHPSDWKSREVRGSAKGFTLVPIDDGRTLKSKRPSMISVVAEMLPRKQTMTLEEVEAYVLTHATLSNSSRLSDWYIPSFQLLESGDTTVLGHPGRRYVYTGEQASVKYKAVEYVASFDGKLYTIRFRADPADFEADLAIFEKTLASLTSTKPAVKKAPARRTRRQR